MQAKAPQGIGRSERGLAQWGLATFTLRENFARKIPKHDVGSGGKQQLQYDANVAVQSYESCHPPLCQPLLPSSAVKSSIYPSSLDSFATGQARSDKTGGLGPGLHGPRPSRWPRKNKESSCSKRTARGRGEADT